MVVTCSGSLAQWQLGLHSVRLVAWPFLGEPRMIKTEPLGAHGRHQALT